MLELFGIPLGTASQIGTFGVLLTFLLGIIKVIIGGVPDWLRVRLELGTATLEAWKALEARVAAELEECKRGREADTLARATLAETTEKSRADLAATVAEARAADAEVIRLVRDENFRCRLAVDMLIDELLRKDPNSDAARRAKAVMLVAKGPQKTGGGK